MYTWRESDPGEVREELAQIASIGFDVVRIFALAQDFIPLALTVDATMIARLVEVVQMAADVFRKLRRARDAGDLEPEDRRARKLPQVLDVTADEYYGDPARHFARLYARWLSRGE